MKLLAINSSISRDDSVSRRLMSLFLDYWQQRHPEAEVLYYDLAEQPIAHFSSEIMGAKQKNAEFLSQELKTELALSETFINEFLSASEVVIAVPMYNFSIPTQLKAWIDRIMVAGRTFKYTEQGVIGLAAGKKVNLISTRGNHYSSNASMQAMDHQENYLKTIFNFMGITELSIIRAEGLHLGESFKEKALEMAEQKIENYFSKR